MEQQVWFIIGQQCDIIIILVQYNFYVYQFSSYFWFSLYLDFVGIYFIFQGSGIIILEYFFVIDLLMEQDEGFSIFLVKQSSFRIVGDINKKILELCVVFIKKFQLEFGVYLCGGNLYGVFVVEVEDDSFVKGFDGFVLGDFILEYGSLDVWNKIVEEVYVEMLKFRDGVCLKVQYCFEEFMKVKGLFGDSFYIRVLYDWLVDVEYELSFKKDDIFYVDDILFQGMFGFWMVWQLDENVQKIQCGQIFSKYVMD